MSCHGNNKESKGTHNHSPIKHLLHMILCCGLPILIFAALPFISRISPGSSRMLAVIAPFICPIMMIGMIPLILGGGKNRRSGCCENKGNNDSLQLELDKSTE